VSLTGGIPLDSSMKGNLNENRISVPLGRHALASTPVSRTANFPPWTHLAGPISTLYENPWHFPVDLTGRFERRALGGKVTSLFIRWMGGWIDVA